jgi:DNA-binding LacI/PurR family transcriptional regulator
MSVGIKAIAQACGLSYNTVSDILNRGREHLYRPETRERVQRVASDLNYRPNRSARSMRSSRTYVVGFLASNMGTDGFLSNHIVYPFLVGMSHYFTDRGYHVSLVERKEVLLEQPDEIPVVLQEKFFDGLVVHYGVSQAVRDLLPQLQVPVIWWDADVFEEFDCIFRDETSVVCALTRHLIELGHQRIAFMVGETSWHHYRHNLPVHFSYIQRYEGFLAEMEQHGLEATRIVGYESSSVAKQLKDQDITAVITMGGDQSRALIPACLKLGWSIPEFLTVASCDVETRLRHHRFMEGGMGYDRYAAGEQAGQMLHEKIETPSLEIPTVRLVGELIAGQTITSPRS